MCCAAFEFKQLTRNLFKVIAVRNKSALLENQFLESLNSYTPKPLQANYYEIFRQNRQKFTKEEGRRKKEEEPTFLNVGLKIRT